MQRLSLFFALVCLSLQSASAQWTAQNSGTDVQLRGISAVSGRVAWASGAKGTVLRTIDSGDHWENLSVAGAEALDFRDIQAFDDKTAYVLSIGPGEQSRIYRTDDGGQHWRMQFTNKDPKAFYDCFAFWDRTHGIALSDSVDGKFLLLITSNGDTWTELQPKSMPAALHNEGAFAASGTCIASFGKKDVWFGTGGPAARVFHSSDNGRKWTVASTPILSGAASQGIFSVAFWNSRDGVIVGGDYQNPKNAEKSAAFTHDGGKTWKLVAKSPSGYRSAIAIAMDSSGKSPVLVAVGTSGSNRSLDRGISWEPDNSSDCNAVSFAGPVGWAVGSKGTIYRVREFVDTTELQRK